MRQNCVRWSEFKQKIKQGAVGVALGATLISGGCATTNAFRMHLPLTEICQTTSRSSSCSRSNLKLIEELRQSAVLIRSGNVQGSGIIIGHQDNHTIIVTNRHVVDPESNPKDQRVITIRNNGNTFKPARILIAPHGLDLAIMFVEGKVGPCRKMDFNKQTVGTNVIVVGSPLGSEDSVTKGIISNLNPEKAKNGFEFFTIQSDAAINPGNSGGGIFDAQTGELIGIMSFKIRMSPFETAEGMSFALPISLLKEFPYSGWDQVKKDS